MKKLENIFKNWLNSKLGNQISIIDEICNNTDLDANVWFKNFISDIGTYSGDDFLDSLLEQFSVYLKCEFEKNFLKYLEPEGYSIYNKPYYGMFIDILDISEENNNIKFDLSFDLDSEEEFVNLTKKLNLSQKEELMKNKLFSYVINQTNFDFYSNNDIRALKLRSLNEHV